MSQEAIIKQLGYIPTLIISDGHGLTDETGSRENPGKRTPIFSDGTYTLENEFNRSIVNQLEFKAKLYGFDVVQVAPEDFNVPLATRCQRANAIFEELKKKYTGVPWWKLAVYIEVHYNAMGDAWATIPGGIETYFFPGSAEGKRLAEIMNRSLLINTGQVNRGVKSADFYVLKNTNMVATLLECGFMDVDWEAKLMKNPVFIDETSTEILTGSCEYFGVTWDPKELQPKVASEDMQKIKAERDQAVKDLASLKEALRTELAGANHALTNISKLLK